MPEPAYPARSGPGRGAAWTASDDVSAALPPCTADLQVRPDGDRTAVVLSGGLDLGSRRLLPDLRRALASPTSGVDLFLDAVAFCDCAGLGVLLELRAHALAGGRTVTVRSAGSAVGRLLDLTGTRDLFAEAGHPPVPPEGGVPAAATRPAALRTPGTR
ncbi:STAS domain-containing protein [Streptomyces sp. NPDC057794]|uniref:STAS domain-containing protein n=1 Tax=Streptomyces sp. NPDC057794 TaxID=3346251 RepID=UPI0036A67D5A